MSHLEYFTKLETLPDDLERAVARLESAVTAYVTLVYGDEVNLNVAKSIEQRIYDVIHTIEGLG